MRTLRCRVEYDGSGLSGWQRQDNGPTVQGHLETALGDLLEHEVLVRGASRTDAGVHARGQVCSFETERTIPAGGIGKATNSRLPDNIAILSCEDVDASFNPRFDSSGKLYRYQIWTGPIRSPLLRLRAWHLPQALSIELMKEGAQHLVGEHNFSSFRATGCSAKTAVRRVSAIDVRAAGELVTLDVRGNAFLRNMVRILAGTLADVGMARISPSQTKVILEARDRTLAGQTAPAQGLCLERVFYPPEHP